MHALDLLLQIRAPLDFAQLDERDCVRRVYAAVIEQIYDPARLASEDYVNWVGENVSALCEIAEYYGVDCYEDMSAPDFTIHEEQVALFQRLVFHFISMVEDKDALMKTCNKVWKMSKLTPKQLCAEGERMRAAVYQKKTYEVSEETLVEVEKMKAEKKKSVMKKVVKMMKW